jgi:hypothetical protein
MSYLPLKLSRGETNLDLIVHNFLKKNSNKSLKTYTTLYTLTYSTPMNRCSSTFMAKIHRPTNPSSKFYLSTLNGLERSFPQHLRTLSLFARRGEESNCSDDVPLKVLLNVSGFPRAMVVDSKKTVDDLDARPKELDPVRIKINGKWLLLSAEFVAGHPGGSVIYQYR